MQRGEMIKRLSIATFSIVTLACLTANAANDDGPTDSSAGWTDAPAEKAEAPAEPAAEKAPTEAQPTKKEASQTVTVKVETTASADAQKDEAPDADAKKFTEHRHD